MNCFKQHKVSTNPCPDCGFNENTADQSPHLLRLRTILNGKYLVGKVLGQGGFGITYIGWDLNLGLRIALKEYYPSGYVTRETTSTSSATVQPFTGSEGDFFLKGREKFINEARSLAKFFTLPGIVSVKDYFLENGTAYITMEFIDGQTLKDYVANMGGKLIAAQVFDLMKPVMSSLADVHKAGIIHRDISPDNIMISKDGYLKLLDFGAARDFTQAGAKSMSVMLKPGFAPEEQYRSKGEQGPWTDIYALSATMYRCITGITPDESVERIRKDTVMPPSAMGIAIDLKKESALMMGMAVLQSKRFQSIPAIYSAMYGTAVPGSTPAPAAAPSATPSPQVQQAGAPPQRMAPPPPPGVPGMPQQAAIPPQYRVPPPPGAPGMPPPQYGTPPPQVAMPSPQVAIPPVGAPQAAMSSPSQKSGSWISNNKAVAGILGGVILLVVALGVILLIMFLPGGNNSNVNASPSPGTGINNSPPPSLPPPPPVSVLNNTTWELSSVFAEGITLDRDYLNSVGLFITFWFHEDGNFTGVYDSEYGYGTWSLSGDEIFVIIDGERQTLLLQPEGNTFLWVEGDVGVMTFTRNDYISFNPPGGGGTVVAPPPDFSRDNHFVKGSWLMIRGDNSIYNTFQSHPFITFFSNGDLFASRQAYGTDGEWGTWDVLGENEIVMTDNRGTSMTFTVASSLDTLSITDSSGNKSDYERESADHPYGNWILVDYNEWIWIFGLSENIAFYLDGYVYASEPGEWLNWWFDIGYFDIIGVLNPYTGEQEYFRYEVRDGYLTITDSAGDWLRLERNWW